MFFTIAGEILWYILVRDNIEIYRDLTSRQHKDDNAIHPYFTYTYLLRVCNSVGCVASTEVKVSTLQVGYSRKQNYLILTVAFGSSHINCSQFKYKTLPSYLNSYLPLIPSPVGNLVVGLMFLFMCLSVCQFYHPNPCLSNHQ